MLDYGQACDWLGAEVAAPSYKGFVLNYNMQGMTKSLSELFAMLKTAEVEIKKEHNVLLVNKTTDFKKSGKSTKEPKVKKPQKDCKMCC
jgi:hypothetical protein